MLTHLFVDCHAELVSASLSLGFFHFNIAIFLTFDFHLNIPTRYPLLISHNLFQLKRIYRLHQVFDHTWIHEHSEFIFILIGWWHDNDFAFITDEIRKSSEFVEEAVAILFFHVKIEDDEFGNIAELTCILKLADHIRRAQLASHIPGKFDLIQQRLIDEQIYFAVIDDYYTLKPW